MLVLAPRVARLASFWPETRPHDDGRWVRRSPRKWHDTHVILLETSAAIETSIVITSLGHNNMAMPCRVSHSARVRAPSRGLSPFFCHPVLGSGERCRSNLKVAHTAVVTVVPTGRKAGVFGEQKSGSGQVSDKRCCCGQTE